jgi:hypothetical protein
MLVVPRFSFLKPALPMTAPSPPCGPEWVHEIKHDGYRMMARRDAAGPGGFFSPQIRWILTVRDWFSLGSAGTLSALVSYVLMPQSKARLFHGVSRRISGQHRRLLSVGEGG